MNKSSKRWKVFVLVLCMLFTMTPATVFADDQAGAQPDVVVDQTGGQTTPPNPDPPIPPVPEPPAPPNPEPPIPPVPETATLPAIDTVSPPAFQMLNTVLETKCSGTIEITKVINNDPGTNDEFKFEIFKWNKHQNKWDQKPVRTVTRAGAGVVKVDGLYDGEYKVKEVDLPDYYVVDDSETDKFTVGTGSVVPVTFTNTYTTGTITIEKKIKNGIPELNDTFTFEIYKGKENRHGDWEWDRDPFRTVTRAGVGIVTVEDLAKGKYLVKEVDIPDHYYVDDIYESVYIERPNYSDKVTFTNEYTAGTITIVKTIKDSISGLHDTFTFDIYKWTEDKKHKWDWELVKSVDIEGAGSVIEVGLDDGKYQIVERDIDNYDKDQAKPIVEIKSKNYHHDSKCQHHTVDFTNTYTGPTTGSITLTKYVDSEIGIPATKFTFVISGPKAYTTTVAITTNTSGTAIIENLEPGDYTVTEAYAEDFYPEENDYDITKSVAAGKETTVEFTNYYDPEESEPLIKKEVALYNGTIPTGGFEKSLTLTELNKSVIYRISVANHDAKVLSDEINLRDIYDFNGAEENITSDLQIWHVDELQGPDGFHWGETYYYIDTLTQNGIYTNTVYLCGETPRSINTIETGDGYECEAMASSTAIVTVSYTPPNNNGGGGGGGGGSPHYDVTYNANYPTGSGISGTVPKDPNSYNKNTTVSVKDNTGDLKAGTYTFIGWNTKADGTGTMYLPGSTFNITADTILYAQWKLASEPAAAVVNPNAGTDGGGTVAAESAAGLDDVPKTGTGAPLIPMFLLGLLSLAGITFCRKKVLD